MSTQAELSDRIERVNCCRVSSGLAARRRRRLATCFFILGVLFTVLWVQNWTYLSARTTCELLGLALAFTGLGVGVELGREWARWFSGALGLLVGAPSMWFAGWMIAGVIGTQEWGLKLLTGVWVLLVPGLSIAAAVYCFLPTTRKHFADVREARARARGTPI